MHLEQLVIDLTQAVRDLTATLKTTVTVTATTSAPFPSPAEIAPSGEVFANAASPEQALIDSTKKKARKTKETPAAAPAAPAATPLELTKSDIVAFGQKMLDAGLGNETRAIVLALGAERVSEIAPEKYVEAHALFTAKLAGIVVKTEKAVETPKAEVTEEAVTVEQVVKLAVKLNEAGYTAKIKAINAQLGVARISLVPAEKCAEAYALLQVIEAEMNAVAA